MEGKTAKRHDSAGFIVFLIELTDKAKWARDIHIVPDISRRTRRSGRRVPGRAREGVLSFRPDLMFYPRLKTHTEAKYKRTWYR